jgi:adenosine kinase
LPEKIHVLNVSFTVNGVVEKFGGTAGNIAYGLSLLGEKPVIIATIGRDYHRYFEWLTRNNIPRDNIRIIEEELTASAYITTDPAHNQTTIFNPATMKLPSSFDFDSIEPKESFFIIAPGNLEDMMSYSLACKARGISYIFDPGQSLSTWGSRDLLTCIEGSEIMVSNDYELEMIISKTGLSKKKLIKLTNNIITTMGELGSHISGQDCEIEIPAIKPEMVMDPTGAGDAYRAGLIKGLVEGNDLEQSARMGSACASFAVECHGTQEYYFDTVEFERRLH